MHSKDVLKDHDTSIKPEQSMALELAKYDAQKHDHYMLWVKVLEGLKDEYGVATYNSWFSHLSFQGIKDGILKITAPSKFIRECIINNYFSKIRTSVSELNPDIKIIDLRVKQNRLSHTQEEQLKKTVLNDNEKSTIDILDYEISNLSSNLDQKFTFDNFIVGDSNKLALMASKAVAEANGPHTHSILYIHGAVGMGKTHLLQAIASHINLSQPNRKCSYLSAEKFMHQYIISLKNNNSLGFKGHLRSLDILLLDDIQFICGKSSTQQEFSNTLNALVEGGKTVVISSDRSFYQLELDNRTKSRIAGGLVIEIKPSDFNLRCQIITAKAKAINLSLNKEVIEFLAQNITSSIRELEGALNNLALYATNFGMEVNIHTIQEILKECILAHEVKVTVEKVIEVVANYYGITYKELISKSREAKYVLPRQIAAFIAKQVTDQSLKSIGLAIGKRDHATIIHSIKKLEEKAKNDQATHQDITKIINLLGSQ